MFYLVAYSLGRNSPQQGTKHIGNDMGALILFYWDCPTVPDVETLVGLLVVRSSCVLMLEIE
jgi:hypothetical protein